MKNVRKLLRNTSSQENHRQIDFEGARLYVRPGSTDLRKGVIGLLAIIETAKQNGIAPEDYLRCLFEKAPYAETREDWEKLLPWNIEITPYKIRCEWI